MTESHSPNQLAEEFVGFRIWYPDGSVRSSKDGSWDELPSQNVQFVTFYRAETYPIWIETEWVTENYVDQFHGQDYYWLDQNGQPGAGRADQVPSDLPKGAIKTG